MSIDSGLRPHSPARAPDRNVDGLVSALEARGLLDPARRDEAFEVVAPWLGDTHAEAAASLRRRLAEVAAYVGVAFVVAAVAVFMAPRWDDLSLATRASLLLITAVLLAAAGVIVGVTGGGLATLREGGGTVRQRLASALFTGAAVAGAATTMVLVVDWVERTGSEEENGNLVGLYGALTLFVLAAVGYVLAPTLIGHAAMVISVFYGVPFLVGQVADGEVPWIGAGYLAFGLVWLVLAETGVWREPLAGRLVGSALLLIGSQMQLEGDPRWIAYVLTAAVGVVGFVLYVQRRAWPYLALGVIAWTVAVPEALLDWTDGTLGTALALLAAGLTLLASALVGMRLRREVVEAQEEERSLSG